MSFFPLFSFGQRNARVLPKPRRAGKPGKRISGPRLEALEDRFMPSCSSISGYVYVDANHNGLFDPGEAVVANNPIQLKDATGQVVATTTTDANGHYEFDIDPRIDTSPKTITQTLTFPDASTDWSSAQMLQQFDPSLGTLTSVDIISNDSITSTIKVENLDTAAATIDAKVSGTVSLSGPGMTGLTANLSADQTFSAGPFDGSIDFGGTSGNNFGPKTAQGTKSVTLSTASDLAPFVGTGSVSITAATHGTSTASGAANLLLSVKTTAAAKVTVIYHYTPSNCLAAGNYTIAQLSQPAGLLEGWETAGNVTPIPGSVGSDSISVNLSADANLPNNDFGEINPAALAGFVYYDANNNGIMDANEAGIAGATVTLTGQDDIGSVSKSTTTAADGSYHFDNLRPGTYTLSETQPGGYLDGKDTIGTPGGATLNDKFTNINLSEGVQGANNNFGELKPSSLYGFVYADTNQDGQREAGKPGISGVTITLAGIDDRGNAVNQVATTDNNGFYDFVGLRPGTYTITETQPAGWQDSNNNLGTLGGTVGTNEFSGIGLPNATVGRDYNFGETKGVGLSGFVYVDSNNNGLKDPGEAGIAGVTVTLTGVDVLGNAVNRTQLTAADGSYNFTNLKPGVYTIAETQPGGYLDGKDTIGTQGGVTVNDHFMGIVVQMGTSGVNNNFGELLPSSLYGFVYLDSFQHHHRDITASALGQIQVVLTGVDDLGNSVWQSMQTDANGFYDFVNLRPGTYSITEAPTPQFDEGTNSIGSLGGAVIGDQFSQIILASATTGRDYNFGEVLRPEHQEPPGDEPEPGKGWFLASHGFGG
jgi:protocatechuate 3,4-dioxygenase beta subunit